MVGGQDVFSVDGQRIVVVGGTAGIGLGVAAHLVDAGATVVITGRRDAADIAAASGASFVRMDVADRESVAAAFAQIGDQLGAVDCLILNAGIDEWHGEADDIDLDVFERVVDVNTLGVVRALAAGISLVPEGGSVVVTSSPAGSITTPGMAAYSASKAALDMLVRTWALELGPKRIRVNAVLPGIVESEMDGADTTQVEVIRRMTANGVYRQAREMGPVYQFLASPASVTLTGSLVGAHDGISVGFSAEVMEHLAAGVGDEES